MRAEKYCGKGCGSDALTTLCHFLAKRLGVEQFMLQPSARNPRARRAYEKVGFMKLDVPLELAMREWGPNDYHDSLYMVKTITKGENQ
jgi:RimJ/RimL family protein N-acetyltransferase